MGQLQPFFVTDSASPRYLQIRPVFVVISVFSLTAIYTLATLTAVPLLRLPLSFVLFALVPGLVALSIADGSTLSLGKTLMYSAATGVVLLGLVSVVISLIYPRVGVEAPLQAKILAPTMLVLLLGQAAWMTRQDDYLTVRIPEFEANDIKFALALLVVVLIAVEGAVLVNEFQFTGLMYVLIGLLMLLTAALLVYGDGPVTPLAVFSIALALLFHRSLLSDFVVGFDIQLNFHTASLLLEQSRWDPSIGGTFIALPIVTVVPVVFTNLSGVGLHLTFKTLQPILFALTPVGIYYLSDEYFSPQTAIFGALTFLFYYRSFYNTPGKQLLAELFVILILQAAFDENLRRRTRWVLLSIFGIGLIQSHYGMLYITAISLLGAYVIYQVYQFLAPALERLFDQYQYHRDHDITALRRIAPAYATLLLISGSCWYILTSPRLSFTLTQLPLVILNEIRAVVLGETIGRSAVGTAQSQTALLRQIHILLFILIMGLAVVGTIAILIRDLDISKTNSKYREEQLELTLLAAPFFGYLGLSVGISGLIGFPRLYQIALLFTAPLAFTGLKWVWQRLAGSFTRSTISSVTWTILALFLLFNSGLVYTVAGTPIASNVPFDPGSHTDTYWEEERAAAAWVSERSAIERREPMPRLPRPIGSPAIDAAPPDSTIHTDEYTVGIFQAVAPTEYYTGVYPPITYSRDGSMNMNAGYIFLRTRSVTTTDQVPGEAARPAYISPKERAKIHRTSNQIYDNQAVEIFWRSPSVTERLRSQTQNNTTG